LSTYNVGPYTNVRISRYDTSAQTWNTGLDTVGTKLWNLKSVLLFVSHFKILLEFYIANDISSIPTF
jgi:hypothetical protein